MKGGWFQRAIVAICALGASLGMCSPDLPAGASPHRVEVNAGVSHR